MDRFGFGTAHVCASWRLVLVVALSGVPWTWGCQGSGPHASLGDGGDWDAALVDAASVSDSGSILVDDAGTGGSTDGSVDAAMLPPGDLVVVSPTLLSTSESGLSVTFTLSLSAAPIADVSVAIASSDPNEATVDPVTVTFTPSDWNASRIITVTGVDDSLRDGPRPFTVTIGPATSADPRYAGKTHADLVGTNADDDIPGFVVSSLVGFPTEAGGTATFTVALATAPSANVALALSSSDATEGTVSPTGLVFTPANWNVPRTVTVTGVNDFDIDGAVPYAIVLDAAISSDTGYQGLDPSDVVLHTVDDDQPGYVVSAPIGALVDSTGSSATFDVALTARPSSNVSVPVSSAVPSVATAAPTTLVFTSANWNVPQTITLSVAKIDDVDDSDASFDVVLGAPASSDPWFAALDPLHVPLVVVDDDTAGLRLGGATLGNPPCGSVGPASLVTWEKGRDDSFTVRLCSQPVANVTVTVASTDTTEANPNPTTLTFTAANWAVAQTVQVTGVDDGVADGDQPFSITLSSSSSDASYAGLTALSVPGTHVDVHVLSNGLLATLSAPPCAFATGCGPQGTPSGPTDVDPSTGYGFVGLTTSSAPASLTWNLGADVSLVEIDAVCPGVSGTSVQDHTVYARRLSTDPWTLVGTIPAGSTGASLSLSGTYRQVMVTTVPYATMVIQVPVGPPVTISGWNLFCTDLRIIGSP